MFDIYLRYYLLLVVEQHVRQALKSLLLIRFLNEERDVVVAAAIRDHTYRYGLHSVKHQGFETKVAPVEIAYNADDTHVRVYCNCAILLKLVYNLVKVRCVVDTHRNAHLACCNHVDGSLIALEYLEHLAQEACGKEHAARLDLDGCNVVLGGYGLDFTLKQNVVDNCAFGLRVQCVLKANWDACKLGWLNTCRMQNLGTKIGKLGSLLEVELANGLGLIHNTWVVVVHSVDVGPNLNLLSWQSCTNKLCCKVATATQQIVYLAIGVAADKALCDVYLIALVLLHNGRQLLLDILRVGLGILVCAHKVESRQ